MPWGSGPLGDPGLLLFRPALRPSVTRGSPFGIVRWLVARPDQRSRGGPGVQGRGDPLLAGGPRSDRGVLGVWSAAPLIDEAEDRSHLPLPEPPVIARRSHTNHIMFNPFLLSDKGWFLNVNFPFCSMAFNHHRQGKGEYIYK